MKQRQRYQRQGTPQRITKAVTHIRLIEVNPGKLAALDQLAPVYLALCQQYVSFFCTQAQPDKFHTPIFPALLSERWHRVAIQQAAGIANFLTTSDGKHYGTFHGKLRERQKRRRKAKLRKCLEKKGLKKLPSTSSKSGQRLSRNVRQEINRSVNECFAEHPGAQFAYEHLSVATMKYKARAMNAYLYASNLAHIPRQIAWNAAKRGRRATRVKSAYSSQECSVCHYVDRANRPDQQTFCCQVCGLQTHADLNAATNVAGRVEDIELQACKGRQAVKALLMQRHEVWKRQHGWP